MAIFDSLISEAAEKFGLGDKAGGLLSGLLSMITSSEGGGISGLISKFTSAGLGDVVSSWVSGGDNKEITGDQLSSVLGNDAISGLAQKAGLSSGIASTALAFMLPKVIDKLTPNGVLPTGIPDMLKSYLGGFGDVVGKGIGAAGNLASGAAGAAGAGAAAVGAGLSGAAGAGMAGAKQAADFAGDTAKSGMSWVLKLLPLLVILGVAYWAWQSCSAPTTPKTTTVAPTAAPAPKVDSSIQVINANGKYKVTAVVPDEKTKAEVLKQLEATYGKDKFEANVTVNANAKPAGWLTKLGDALKELKAPGTELSIIGSAMTISGLAADAANALKAKLGSLFGADFSVSTKILDIGAAVKDAAAAAASALAGLKPGFTADELAKALNLEVINFASGSNAIPKENEDLLKKSADAIKQAPAGTKLEVGGHTDSTGNAAGNDKLSAARAAAVKAFLDKAGVKADVLTAKGYGSAKSIASNDTKEGQFKNRRIEFSVIK